MADITDALLAPWTSVHFADSAAIDTFFQAQTGKHYLSWFNATLAKKGP